VSLSTRAAVSDVSQKARSEKEQRQSDGSDTIRPDRTAACRPREHQDFEQRMNLSWTSGPATEPGSNKGHIKLVNGNRHIFVARRRLAVNLEWKTGALSLFTQAA
jgi:hypothetical protein